MKNYFSNIFLLMWSICFIVSCASTPIEDEYQEISHDSAFNDVGVQIVATDFVSTLLQVPGYDSWSVTLQVSEASAGFGKALNESLRKAGYGIQRVKQGQGQNFVNYRKRMDTEDDKSNSTFELRINGVVLLRDYRYGAGRWIPTSPMRVKGVEPVDIKVFDDLHIQDGLVDEFVSGVEFLDKRGQVVKSSKNIVKVRNPRTRISGERIQEERYLIMSRVNLFTKQRAVDNTKLYDYTPVSTVILNFPSSDTGHLGESNKNAIAELIQQMSPESDGFIIRGCSHGKSLIWDGTESDSLERQNRVNRELLISGVHHEQIREEGCFQNPDDIPIPKNSVVLTLRRQIKAL